MSLRPRAQQDAIRQTAELLDGEAAIDDSDDDLPVLRVERPIHDEQVAIMDAEAGHGVALHPDEEGGFPVLDQVLVEAQAVLEVVGGRRREACRDGPCQHREAGYGDNARLRQGEEMGDLRGVH